MNLNAVTMPGWFFTRAPNASQPDDVPATSRCAASTYNNGNNTALECTPCPAGMHTMNDWYPSMMSGVLPNTEAMCGELAWYAAA